MADCFSIFSLESTPPLANIITCSLPAAGAVNSVSSVSPTRHTNLMCAQYQLINHTIDLLYNVCMASLLYGVIKIWQ